MDLYPASASSGVNATIPLGVAMPFSLKSSIDTCSCTFKFRTAPNAPAGERAKVRVACERRSVVAALLNMIIVSLEIGMMVDGEDL